MIGNRCKETDSPPRYWNCCDPLLLRCMVADLFLTPGFDLFYVLIDWNIPVRKTTLLFMDTVYIYYFVLCLKAWQCALLFFDNYIFLIWLIVICCRVVKGPTKDREKAKTVFDLWNQKKKRIISLLSVCFLLGCKIDILASVRICFDLWNTSWNETGMAMKCTDPIKFTSFSMYSSKGKIWLVHGSSSYLWDSQ